MRHDLFGKPVLAFADHALELQKHFPACVTQNARFHLHEADGPAISPQHPCCDRNDGDDPHGRHAADRNRHSGPAHEGGCDGARAHPRARARATRGGQGQAQSPPGAEGLYEANRRAFQSIEMARHRSGENADGDGWLSRSPGGSRVLVFPAGDASLVPFSFGLLYFCHPRFRARFHNEDRRHPCRHLHRPEDARILSQECNWQTPILDGPRLS